eukprot:CAMPEP_0172458122 /NCGR_PEP_ID=MMETSP1065-20121228/25907_1 /TAXON_ID=265537 /ORGANISM="Amphiprora paludosa, Strain CCMP125" /LENGTH=644 /DNA_ID=CAMNT_0013212213 /DNA_START=129 /DNA_END=2063 /DNA_ORIENTATION=+
MDANQPENIHEAQMPVEEDEDEDRGIEHPNGEDEDDEDDEDDDDEPMDEEDDEDDDVGNAGEEDTLEGGVADGDERANSASDADIVLYFLCSESFKDHPDHPILKPGVKVRIGLGKNTRLSAVMQRYVYVCNQELSVDGNNNITCNTIELADLEFVHAAVLKGSDTAEQGALMKDDVVRVRQNRWEQHEREREANRMQRESDVGFLEEMRALVDNQANSTIALDCHGPPLPSGRNVFSRQRQGTTIFCDASLVSKRCPWLGRTISGALAGVLEPVEDGAERAKSVVSLPEPLGDVDSSPSVKAPPKPDGDDPIEDAANLGDDDEFEDDHPIQVLDFAPRLADRDIMNQNEDAAAQIENDDDSQGEAENLELGGRSIVVIPNHPVEAMRLLLEYCYTNRVISLGQEAFRIAARTKPSPREYKGNLPPFGMKRWPGRGEPTVSFELAAATLTLAEEASMPRFSLMCEVAASHLVSPSNVVEALMLCKRTQDQWGNQLQRLRRAAMEVVFHSRAYGVYDNIYKQPSFKESVVKKAPLLVPSLFKGTADCVEESLGKKQYHNFKERDWKTSLYEDCRRYDDEDKLKRARERAKYRPIQDSAPDDHPLIVDEYDALGNEVASRKCMKRLRGHSVRSTLRREKRERRGSG